MAFAELVAKLEEVKEHYLERFEGIRIGADLRVSRSRSSRNEFVGGVVGSPCYEIEWAFDSEQIFGCPGAELREMSLRDYLDS